MGIVGADFEQLRTLSRTFTQAADRLEQLVRETSGRLNSVRWVGPDADRYRGEWQGQSVQQLSAAANALRTAASALQRNADEQERASSVGGAPGPPLHGPTPNLAEGFRDFTNASPFWPITNDTLLSSVPGIKDAMPFADGAAIAFDDRLSPGDKLQEGSHLAYDTLAGAVRSKGAETGDLPGYLAGVAMSQWGDVVYEGAHADFSPGGLKTVGDYVASNPSGAFDAAVGAVKDYLPKLFSNFTI